VQRRCLARPPPPAAVKMDGNTGQRSAPLPKDCGHGWTAPAVGDCRGARVRRAPQRMCKRKRLRRMESAAQRQAPGCGGGDGEGQSRTRRPSNLIPALCGAIIRHCNRTATTTRTCMHARRRSLHPSGHRSASCEPERLGVLWPSAVVLATARHGLRRQACHRCAAAARAALSAAYAAKTC